MVNRRDDREGSGESIPIIQYPGDLNLRPADYPNTIPHILLVEVLLDIDSGSNWKDHSSNSILASLYFHQNNE